MKKDPVMQPRTVAVLTGLAIGLGITVHPFFFLVALGIILAVTMEWAVRKGFESLHQSRMIHRHS